MPIQFANFDAASLAASIDQILAMPSLSAAMSREARAFAVRYFDWEPLIDRLTDLYRGEQKMAA